MAQNPAKTLALAKLGEEAYRVLMYAIATLDYENLLVMNQTEAAGEMRMKQQNFGRALNKLIAAEVIEKGPKVSGRNTYRMNPSFGWKGSAKSHRDALNARMKHAGLAVIDGGK
ncbi:MAG: RepL [Microviridae sp.]|nr:MAG: RepL [Microviridae sp.]